MHYFISDNILIVYEDFECCYRIYDIERTEFDDFNTYVVTGFHQGFVLECEPKELIRAQFDQDFTAKVIIPAEFSPICGTLVEYFV